MPIEIRDRPFNFGTVSAAFPTTFSPYWRSLPLGRMKMFLAGYFFVGAAGGSMEQLPRGLFPGGFYASKRVVYSPRDLFLMFTDGITAHALYTGSPTFSSFVVGLKDSA